jgi:DNA-binding IclR family transcriptional regulator
MPRITGKADIRGVQAVMFALNILEYLAGRGTAVGVTELAQHFATTKSRMHRHLRTLTAAGYIVQDADTERYRTSTRLIALGRAVSGGFDLTIAARDALRELRDALGQSVALSRFEQDGVSIVATLAGVSAVEIGVKPGSVLQYHASAQGKIMLAYADEAQRTRLLCAPLPALTPATITDPRRLRRELQQIRSRGWAVAPNETVIGLNALAAPILDAAGASIGAVAIVDSVQFVPPVPSARQIEGVIAAARRISANLGYRDEARPMRQAQGDAPHSPR